MTVVLQEVPGHVQIVPHIRNHIQVQGGTNWDLSRSAVATPLTQLKDPEPILVEPAVSAYDAVVPQVPVAVVTFKANSSVVTQQGVRALKAAKGKPSLYVTGHADGKEAAPLALGLKRAEAVARRLRVEGVEVQVRSAGTQQPAKPSNRRVEVYAAPVN